ncbi:hypothetical protein G6F56_009026 [Rhizopus delemar]|nr:hypothetical protein G6F56_009026 [Rhizopus delemar]
MKSKSDGTNEKIPRPMNCFMIYRLERQREIVSECPGANHRDISKITAKWWKEMTKEEKQLYREKAEKKKNEHNKLYPNYKYSPQRKTKPSRAYKKKPKNEFVAMDFHNRKQLKEIYERTRPAREEKEHVVYVTEDSAYFNMDLYHPPKQDYPRQEEFNLGSYSLPSYYPPPPPPSPAFSTLVQGRYFSQLHEAEYNQWDPMMRPGETLFYLVDSYPLQSYF